MVVRLVDMSTPFHPVTTPLDDTSLLGLPVDVPLRFLESPPSVIQSHGSPSKMINSRQSQIRLRSRTYQ